MAAMEKRAIGMPRLSTEIRQASKGVLVDTYSAAGQISAIVPPTIVCRRIDVSLQTCRPDHVELTEPVDPAAPCRKRAMRTVSIFFALQKSLSKWATDLWPEETHSATMRYIKVYMMPLPMYNGRRPSSSLNDDVRSGVTPNPRA